MAEAPDTLEGWYVLHDFRRVDWARWKALPEPERRCAVEEAARLLEALESPREGAGAGAAYRILGHKSDLFFLILRPTVDALSGAEDAIARTRLADFAAPAYSYLSVTELSLYEAYARGGTQDIEELMQQPFVKRRLRPEIPDAPYVCFYPMNKRRGETVNWYAEDFERRRAMMREHGATGRKYHGQVTQMITGSTGLDDWEWGITLFAVDPLPVKKLVYEMRFDEVTARYGEFGPFQFGIRLRAPDLASFLG